MKRQLMFALVLALGLTLLVAQSASAHERRTVGKYEFVVGFINEPAYVNQPNAIDLRVTNTETKNPVEGLEKTVNAEVIFGGKTMPVQLRTRFGQPGAYAGDFFPTKAGTYIFHFTGSIEALKIDEKFESGPGRFNDVQDTTPLQFPEKLADPVAAAAQLKAAQDAASRAQTVAYVGVTLGVLGVILGALGLRRK